MSVPYCCSRDLIKLPSIDPGISKKVLAYHRVIVLRSVWEHQQLMLINSYRSLHLRTQHSGRRHLHFTSTCWNWQWPSATHNGSNKNSSMSRSHRTITPWHCHLRVVSCSLSSLCTLSHFVTQYVFWFLLLHVGWRRYVWIKYQREESSKCY